MLTKCIRTTRITIRHSVQPVVARSTKSLSMQYEYDVWVSFDHLTEGKHKKFRSFITTPEQQHFIFHYDTGAAMFPVSVPGFASSTLILSLDAFA